MYLNRLLFQHHARLKYIILIIYEYLVKRAYDYEAWMDTSEDGAGFLEGIIPTYQWLSKCLMMRRRSYSFRIKFEDVLRSYHTSPL